MDVDMARAARKVIVSAERIVSTDEISGQPWATMLPHFAVDAVVEAPYGAYPHECYGLYEADTGHFDVYAEAVRDGGAQAARAYVAEHVDAHPDFAAFLAAAGPGRLADRAAAAARLMPR
jgi:glutaconate CoA-transferase subunit A